MTYKEMKDKCIYIRTGLMITGIIMGLSISGFFGIIMIIGSLYLISFTANEVCPVCDYVRDNTNYLSDSKNKEIE